MRWRDAAGLASDVAPLVTDAYRGEPVAESAYKVELRIDDDVPRLIDEAKRRTYYDLIVTVASFAKTSGCCSNVLSNQS